jgi:hypothetical protein
MKKVYFFIAVLTLFGAVMSGETAGKDSTAGAQAAAPQQPADTSSGLSLWEVGGGYFSMPYYKHTVEVAINGWYEPEDQGLSIYGSYAFTDNFTLKLEVPFAFSDPVMGSFKITGLFGKQWEAGDAALAGDLSLETFFGESPEIFPALGVNAAKRWGIFALLGRISGGPEVFLDSAGGYDIRGEAEIAPFVYTGQIGMVGLPVIYEYTSGDSGGSALNIGLDWELYLPLNISLNAVPRYEILNGDFLKGEGFSIWFGISWMYIP